MPRLAADSDTIHVVMGTDLDEGRIKVKCSIGCPFHTVERTMDKAVEAAQAHIDEVEQRKSELLAKVAAVRAKPRRPARPDAMF